MVVPRPERPLDHANGALANFASGLRQLREIAGGPGYRELGRRAHYSVSTLSEAAGGRRLPSLEVTLAYVRACGGNVTEWAQRWREVTMEIATTDSAVSRSPYVGLTPFVSTDAEWFFGRKRLIEQLVMRVARQRLVVLVGASGSGKSSLLGAGLVAAAQAGMLGPDRAWSVTMITPGVHPMTTVDGGAADASCLLVVDQFEEIFTRCHEAERSRFVDMLLAAVAAPKGRTHVVLGVRSDFHAHCLAHSRLAEAMRDAQIRVGAMTIEELRQAIVQPAVRVGCRIEGDLVATLVAEATSQPGALSLVSHALLETYHRRRGNILTLAAYQEAGGVGGATVRAAEQMYFALTGAQRTIVRDLLLRLTALGEGAEDTKRRIDRSEFDHDDPDTRTVVDTCVQARLLTVDGDTVEIAHEALIRSWPRLRGWLTEDRAGLRIHRQLTEATHTWESLGRDPGALYRGVRLAAAKEWVADHDCQLNRAERSFLEASWIAHRNEHRRNRHRDADLAPHALVRLTPAQLPADISEFVGRAGELATARTMLTTSSGMKAPVLVISGMPGVGKSAFAVKLSHEVRTWFPDGQLFIDLRGYSEHEPLSAARVLSRILPALGMPSTQVPTDIEDLTNTYRGLVTDRRILLVLDNAANADQVKDLIPAAPESAVLITSRSQLPSLTALPGACLLQLHPLDSHDSEQLIRTILVSAPKPVDDADIGRIMELCKHLPLAIRIAATAYLHSSRPLPEFITELEQHGRLFALTIADDSRATVRAVFDLSYRRLTAAAARLFRLLSLVPGPDFCVTCAHHVAGVSPTQAELLLGELTAASLIHPGRPRHYRFHDLVRLYAHDRCVTEDDPADLHAALARLHSYYVNTADAAADALYPTWTRLPRNHPSIVTTDQAPAVPNAAQWMSDEAQNLIATIRYNAQHGAAEIAWYLSESLRVYVVTHGAYRIEALSAFEIALRAARDAENRRAIAAMHGAFISVYLRIRDPQRAIPHIRAQLGHHIELGFAEGEAFTRSALGEALATQGYLRDAAAQLGEALRIAESQDLADLQSFVLLNLSIVEEWRDQLDVAKKYALSARGLIRVKSSGSTEGSVYGSLGVIMIRRGEFDAAIEQHLRALECYQQASDQHFESEALRGLAHAYAKTGDVKASISHATKALSVAEELGDEYDIADSLISLAEIYHELELIKQARSCAESALAMSGGLEYRKAHIEALLRLASIDKTEGRLDRAQRHTRHAIELARKGELLRLRGDAETLLAWIIHEKGNHAEAVRHASDAFTIYQEVNTPYGQTRALHAKGVALLAQGQREHAKVELITSLEIFPDPVTPEIDAIRKVVADIS